MQKMFLTVLDMSIVASFVILAVLAVRLFLKKAPKIYSYILWAVVLFRLICPFSMESAWSMIPDRAQNLPQDVALDTTEYVSVLNVLDATQRTVGDTLNGGIDTVWVRLDSEEMGQQGISMASHLQVWLLFAGVLWPVGIVGMLIYSVVSYIKLRRTLVGAAPLYIKEDGVGQFTKGQLSKQSLGRIYMVDYMITPFVMGIIQPKIYLPSSLAEAEREYIILHEQHHIRRGDHIFKFLGYMALCIHWFNPLVWVAFVQAEKDMEMSCDEAVVKSQGEQIRGLYAASLLKLATGKLKFAGMPLAFGEGDTKGRIQNLAKWKKPKIWICIVAGMVILVVTLGCVLNPRSGSEMAPSKVVGAYDASRLAGSYLESGNPAYDIGANIYGNPVTLSKETAFMPGTSYVTYACQYMTPLSSTLSNGDDGYRYVVGEDTFTKIQCSSGSETVYNVTWEWQPFPWTDEEYREMYLPSIGKEFEISNYHEEMLYQPISEGYCMLWLDGQLLLMKLSYTPQKKPYVWSVFALMPEGWRDVSQPISLNVDMTKYLGMTYKQFQENEQSEVIHYHANFHFSQMQEENFNVIFNASGYDNKLGMAVLTETDEIFRVDSKLGVLLPDFTEEMSVVDFLKQILGTDTVNLEYYIKQGAGTIYYVGNTYVEIGLDSDSDQTADMILDVAVDDENRIGPESRVWLIQVDILSTTHP